MRPSKRWKRKRDTRGRNSTINHNLITIRLVFVHREATTTRPRPDRTSVSQRMRRNRAARAERGGDRIVWRPIGSDAKCIKCARRRWKEEHTRCAPIKCVFIYLFLRFVESHCQSNGNWLWSRQRCGRRECTQQIIKNKPIAFRQHKVSVIN